MLKIAPIALFVYNRLDHIQKTLDSLSKNYLADQSDLFIYSDNAKSSSDINSVNKVRNYCFNIKKFKSVKVIKRDHNLGIAKNLVSGISEILDKHEKIIILEDDLITDKYFLKYMNDSLEKFKNNKEVISIHGYVYPLKKNIYKSSFLKGADCWGWATWKRGWDLYNPNTNFLLDKIISNKREKEFNFNNSYNFMRMLKKTLEKSRNSWAIKWYASAFIENKLTLYPSHSLVHNIGNDGSGTNTSKDESYDNCLLNIPIDIENIDIIENQELRNEFEIYFKSRTNLIKKFYNKIFS